MGTRAQQRRTRRAFTIGVIVAAIVVLALVAIPVPHGFAFSIVERPVAGEWSGEANRSFPVGATVLGTWTGPTGVSVVVRIYSSSPGLAFQGTGSSGSFSFKAASSPYSFVTESVTNQTISVAGSFAMPLL